MGFGVGKVIAAFEKKALGKRRTVTFPFGEKANIAPLPQVFADAPAFKNVNVVARDAAIKRCFNAQRPGADNCDFAHNYGAVYG